MSRQTFEGKGIHQACNEFSFHTRIYLIVSRQTFKGKGKQHAEKKRTN